MYGVTIRYIEKYKFHMSAQLRTAKLNLHNIKHANVAFSGLYVLGEDDPKQKYRNIYDKIF